MTGSLYACRRSRAQAVGSLKAFAAGGTKAYRDIMGWTDTVSASPLGVGALQCIWRPPFLAQYIATISLPVMASGAVIIIFLIATTVRACSCRGGCSFDAVGSRNALVAWWKERRHLATLMVSSLRK